MNPLTRYRERRRQRKYLSEPSQIHQAMDSWFQSELGAALLDAERRCLEPATARLFGFHILQLGCSANTTLLEGCPAGFKINFVPEYKSGQDMPVADNEDLPLGSDSMDAVLIHHALDFTPDSHKLLREATRVLSPGGRLLIVGFNPVSSWGVGKLLRWHRQTPWNGRFISVLRISDWLKLLDFRLEDVRYGGYLPPLATPRIVRHAGRWERIGSRVARPFGCFYVLVARKEVIALTPAMPRWPRMQTPAISGAAPVADAGRTASPRKAKVIKLHDH